ncbi:hypothetical protein [Sphingobium lactosutens]|uniref:hypothetical protein n=1 Tax=Sphingobium lactosutens TaxID=522773 RepID=UPI0015BE4D50|nr:hypothetical protein [Sphingobium lactosutens]
MYSDASISAVAGANGLDYAKNKNRGGRSSAKGRDFEIVYGAYRIVLEAANALRDGALGTDISFHDQVLCFVDDFVASGPGGRTLAQLKSGAASWTGGDHPLGDDFRLQAKLDATCGVAANYELVVGDDARRDALLIDRPTDLSAVSVVSFPGELEDLDLISRLDDLAAALAELSPRDAERVVREQVWRMLLGTWQGSRGDQTLASIIHAAGHGPGAIVAPLSPPYILSDEAKKTLDKVDGLRFNIHKNFFTYDALGWMVRGIADYHCYTPQFEAFVTELTTSQPTDFLSFWAVLKAHI